MSITLISEQVKVDLVKEDINRSILELPPASAALYIRDKYSIHVTPTNLYQIKQGRFSTDELILRAKALQLARSNVEQTAKDSFVLAILKTAVEVKNQQMVTSRGTINSIGFSNYIATNNGMQVQDLNTLFRNIRAEFSFELAFSPDKTLVETALQSVTKFLNSLNSIQYNSLKPNYIHNLEEALAANGVLGFYRALYCTDATKKGGARRVGSFAPYEVDLLLWYFQEKNCLSIYDRFLLHNFSKSRIQKDENGRTPAQRVLDKVNEITGIRFSDVSQINLYTRLMLADQANYSIDINPISLYDEG